jgi:two-component sensor histidine kinase
MDKFLAVLLEKEPPAVVRFGATTLMMAAAGSAQYILALRTGLPGLSGVLTGIFLATFLFGRIAGFYGTALATASAYVVLRQYFPDLPIIAALALFMLMGVGVSLLTDLLRSALKRAIKAERDKDLLFRELSHRAQNNFALITSMAQLQSRAHPNPEVRNVLDGLVGRITALAGAQRHFMHVGSEAVELGSYIDALCEQLRNSLGAPARIAIRCSVEQLTIPSDKALALGLMTNEFVTNAVKYAFAEGHEDGTIDVSVKPAEGRAIELQVRDNGRGCAPDAAEGFGTRLTDILAKQHKASITRENASPGLRVAVRMPASA